MNGTALVLAIAVVGCVSLGGCSERGETFVPVAGTVYYNGQPATSGVVMFQPATGKVARGQIQPDGTYALETLGESDGVVPGVAKVRVSVRDRSSSGTGEVGLGKLLIPERYTDFDLSGLRFEVTPARSEPYDIHLTDGR